MSGATGNHWMDSTTSDGQEGILGVVCTLSSISDLSMQASHVEEYQNTREVETVETEFSDKNEHSKAEKEDDNKDKRWRRIKALLIALSVGFFVVVAALAAVVTYYALHSKETSQGQEPTPTPTPTPGLVVTVDAPRVLASALMNGATRDVEDGATVNRLPEFASPDFEDLNQEDNSCSIESRVRCNGEKGVWQKGLSPSTGDNLDGACLFEFTYTCENTRSLVRSLNFIVDPSLPDITFSSGSKLVADKWITFTLSAPNGGDSEIKSLKVLFDDGSSEPVWSAENSQRFLVRKEGEYTLSVTNKKGHINTLSFSVESSTLNVDVGTNTVVIPDDVVIISSNLLAPMASEGSSVKTVTIGKDLTLVEPGAFSETSVECIEVSGSTYYKSMEGVLFTGDENELVVYPPRKNVGGSYTVPDNTIILGEKAFAGASLTRLTIPITVREIGEGAFSGTNPSFRLLFENSGRSTSLFLLSGGKTSSFSSLGYFVGPDNLDEKGVFTTHVETSFTPETLQKKFLIVQCLLDNDGVYREKMVRKFDSTVGNGTLKTGMCYIEGKTLIPLFEDDEIFTIKLDLDKPVFKEDKLEAALSTPFEFELSDALSGLFSVSAQQGEDTVESLGDGAEKKSSNSNILLSCQKNPTDANWKCTITAHTKGSVTITATDKAGNSETRDITVGEWTCVPEFHVKNSVLTVPDSVEELTSGVLDGCTSVTNVMIGKGVGKIDTGVFDNLTHVKSFSVNADNTVFSADSGALYEAVDGEKRLIRYPLAKEEKTIKILEGTKTIRTHAFYSTKALDYVTIPETLTTIEQDAFKDSSVKSLTFPENTIDIVLPPETGYLNGKVLSIFDNNFTDDIINLSLNLSISNKIDEKTKGRFFLQTEETENKTVTFIVSKETKKYSAKAVYKDGNKTLEINNKSAEVRVIMSYMSSQRVGKKVENKLTFDIDSAFNVTVKKEGSTSANEVDITTSSSVSLGTDRNTITFKENGEYILRVYNADNELLTKEPVFVVNQECVSAGVYEVPEAGQITASSVKNNSVEILVIPESATGIDKDALKNIASCLRAIVVVGNSTVKPESCDFGKDGYTYRHVPVFRVTEKDSPVVALPTWNGSYKSGQIPLLLYSKTVGETLSVTGQSSTEVVSSGTGYQIYALDLSAGEYNIENKDVSFKVVDWSEGKDNYGATTNLVVPYGVYQIGQSQYYYNTTIMSVTLPQTVKIVDSSAFNLCSNLNTVKFCEGLKIIGENAFGLTSLVSVVTPNSLETIGSYAFSNCASLTSVTLNDGLVEILSNPFYGSPVTTITSNNGKFKMSENGMELVDIDSETIVTFACGKLGQDGTYQLSDNIKIIGSYAFRGCSTLKSITLPEGLTKIGESAFKSSGLKSVEIPASVESVGDYAFGYCGYLTSFSIKEGMRGTIGSQILYVSYSLTEITLPESFWKNNTQISEDAFYDSGLTKITFSCGKNDQDCIPGSRNYKRKKVEIVCGECPAK